MKLKFFFCLEICCCHDRMRRRYRDLRIGEFKKCYFPFVLFYTICWLKRDLIKHRIRFKLRGKRMKIPLDKFYAFKYFAICHIFAVRLFRLN